MRGTDIKKIRRLLRLLAVTSLLGIAALGIAIKGLNDAEGSRAQARLDNCHLIKNLVTIGTPRARLAAVDAYLAKTPLANCHHYAESNK